MVTMMENQQVSDVTNNEIGNNQLDVEATKYKYDTPEMFGQIIEQYQGSIYNLCYRMLNDVSEAEDAVQEVFIRAYVHFDSYDAARKLSTWLFSIASHFCLDRLKKRRLPQVFWDEVSANHVPFGKEADQPEHVILASETSAEIQALLHHLTPEDRSVVVLKYWHGLRCQEIAETLNTSVSAVKSRLFRARKKMAAEIEAGMINRFWRQANAAAPMFGGDKSISACTSEPIVAPRIPYLVTG